MQNKVVTKDEWLLARAELLEKEKEHTRAREALAERRRELPWVKVDKEYTFVGPDGEVTFADLFRDRSQLAIYHLMFGAGWSAPCPGCTQWADALNGTTQNFKKADARLIAISRAPYEQIEEQQKKLGWSFTWVSSASSDFNLDFYASSEDMSDLSSLAIGGENGERVEFDRGENHGASVFYRNEAGEIFLTYSVYNRGIEALNGAFGYYDMLPKGRAW